MAFGDIENHDNYYTHQEGRMHVQDERGCFIVYDAALEDLKYDFYVPVHSMIEFNFKRAFEISAPLLRHIRVNGLLLCSIKATREGSAADCLLLPSEG